jgi:5-methylcytosine-specific restriction endonuclease McrA
MAGTYSRIKLDVKFCVYCGKHSGCTWDHVYPVSAAATLADLGIEVDPRLKLMVRACRQCNSTAGSQLFKSFPHKRAHIRGLLLRRYGEERLGPAPEILFVARHLGATQVSTFST